MRLAITGTTGRVGRALADRLAARFEILELPRTNYDLADPDVIERIGELDFDVLLNPAGMTSLEACMDAPDLAQRVNGKVPVALAERCRASGRKMLHFSTDYVLGGESVGLHDEDTVLDPRSVYAETKAFSELGVLQAGACVLRVSWVFGPERPAFPEQVMAKALAGETLAAVSDKTSLPCYTVDLAEWVGGLLDLGCPNERIHACQSGEPVSWHGMTEEVLDCMLAEGALARCPVVNKQYLSEMGGIFRALRPRHTALSTERLTVLLGRRPRDWREALREHVAQSLKTR